MTENIWDRFDSIATPDEVKAEESKFTPVDAGTYEARLGKITPAETRDGLPMLKGEFVRTDNGKRIFYNQPLQNISKPEVTARNIAMACSFLARLTGETVTYTGMSDLANFINTIETGGLYVLDISYGDTDIERRFPRIKVVSRVIEDDTLPFDV